MLDNVYELDRFRFLLDKLLVSLYLSLLIYRISFLLLLYIQSAGGSKITARFLYSLLYLLQSG